MNYENYISAIVEGKNLGLIGWPHGVKFQRMSKQSAIGPLSKLRDVLRDGTCHWKVLKGAEKARLVAQFKEMVVTGEATEKQRKPRARKSKKAADEQEDSEGALDPIPTELGLCSREV
ncbi:hypothetical protein FB451DRAFT_1163990 [Mycena latifolia]|nr:hypothetical protein FB451DRAFT_1163990 [Mycena latifolia]